MSAGSDARRYVVLRGGLSLPADPLLLALELEERGLVLSRDGEDLLVGPTGRGRPGTKANH